MPGLNIITGRKIIVEDLTRKLGNVEQRMLHSKKYSRFPVLLDNNTSISMTAYDGYPRKIFDSERFSIVLEGFIYNWDDEFIRIKLIELAEKISIVDGDFICTVKEFLLKMDGEFIVCIYDKSEKKLFVMNDFLGCLPLYYYKNDKEMIVSREIKFIVPFLEENKFKREALMEYLLFGFPLDENTLIEGINRIRPATFLWFDTEKNELLKETVLPIDFEHVDPEPCESAIGKIRDLFLSSIKNRSGKLRNKTSVLSLSGGLDSRGTLAGLIYSDNTPKVITNVRNDFGESDYARRVAGEFGLGITPFKINTQIDIEKCKKVVFLKDGLNPTSSAHMLDTLTKVTEDFGENTVFYTGLFGGETVRSIHLTKGLKGVTGLVDFLMETKDEYKYSTTKVCRMLDLSEKAVREHLREHLENYVEKDAHKKYARFRFEYDYRWAGEGEDRNRFYLWTSSPYRSSLFFRRAIAIDENKRDTVFFRDFLNSVDPRTTNVEYFCNDRSIYALNDAGTMGVLRFKERLARHALIRKVGRIIKCVKRSLFSFLKPGEKSTNEKNKDFKKILIDLLKNNKDMLECFSIEETKKIIENEDNMTGLHRLFTIFLYAEIVKEWEN
ncbi:MAG: hypothetical protein PHW46_03150, partial [Candidatus Omnitrophica bacterium]|nr:hypothetical protein [Candidatus Omnitrophota bacterium]